jgi:predicted Fe-Mo cluster-binding NifX family protein
MRIAITSDSNLGIDANIYAHFGHTPYFTVVDIQNQLVKKTTIVANPYVEKHQPGEVPTYLSKMDVNLIIAGGMGTKAKDIFKSFGIDVIAGASGVISEIIDQYLKGNLQNDVEYEPADKHKFHDH